MSEPTKKALVPVLRFPEFRDTGEWDSTTFGAAATFTNGKAFKQEELLEQGMYRVLRVGNFFTNKEWYFSDLELGQDKYCDKGDLLYAWSASFGPRIWTGEKVIYHYHIWKVEETKGIDKQFLFVLLDYETERMKSESANGLGLLHITKGAIESWACCIPMEKEQQKIADCMSSIDELVTAQTQKVEALKAHKKGLMQQLFPAEGETVPKLRFPEFRDAGEWEEKKLKHAIDPVVREVTKPETNYLALGIRSHGKGTFQKPDQAPEKNAMDKLYLVNRDDLIVNITFAWEGAIAIADHADHGCHVSHRFPTYVFKSQISTSEFFRYVINQKSFFYKLGLISPGGAGRNRVMNKKDFLEITVNLPSLNEQQKIANCLSSIDDLITTQTQKLAALKAHKKGLMQQLFPAVDEVQP